LPHLVYFEYNTNFGCLQLGKKFICLSSQILAPYHMILI